MTQLDLFDRLVIGIPALLVVYAALRYPLFDEDSKPPPEREHES